LGTEKGVSPRIQTKPFLAASPLNSSNRPPQVTVAIFRPTPADIPQNLQNPAPGFLSVPGVDLPMQKSVYASPPRASFLVSNLSRLADPATQPQGAFPYRQRASNQRLSCWSKSQLLGQSPL